LQFPVWSIQLQHAQLCTYDIRVCPAAFPDKVPGRHLLGTSRHWATGILHHLLVRWARLRSPRQHSQGSLVGHFTIDQVQMSPRVVVWIGLIDPLALGGNLVTGVGGHHLAAKWRTSSRRSSYYYTSPVSRPRGKIFDRGMRLGLHALLGRHCGMPRTPTLLPFIPF